MKLKVFCLFTLLLIHSLAAHHGQDFLVTLDAKRVDPWNVVVTTGAEFTKSAGEEEISIVQGFILGLPGGLSSGLSYRYGDDPESGNWDAHSLTPSLQWSSSALALGASGMRVNFAIAGGYEINFGPRDDLQSGSHRHGEDLQERDCSALLGVPSLYEACQQVNVNARNHTHKKEGSHEHEGIHRHGKDHGFVRLIADFTTHSRSRFAVNLVGVFPDGESVAFGYAAAWRHRFTDRLAMGLEATGDLRDDGQHSLFLASICSIDHARSLTLGVATGLTEEAPDLSVQGLLVWRF